MGMIGEGWGGAFHDSGVSISHLDEIKKRKKRKVVLPTFGPVNTPDLRHWLATGLGARAGSVGGFLVCVFSFFFSRGGAWHLSSFVSCRKSVPFHLHYSSNTHLHFLRLDFLRGGMGRLIRMEMTRRRERGMSGRMGADHHYVYFCVFLCLIVEGVLRRMNSESIVTSSPSILLIIITCRRRRRPVTSLCACGTRLSLFFAGLVITQAGYLWSR